MREQESPDRPRPLDVAKPTRATVTGPYVWGGPTCQRDASQRVSCASGRSTFTNQGLRCYLDGGEKKIRPGPLPDFPSSAPHPLSHREKNKPKLFVFQAQQRGEQRGEKVQSGRRRRWEGPATEAAPRLRSPPP